MPTVHVSVLKRPIDNMTIEKSNQTIKKLNVIIAIRDSNIIDIICN